MTPLYGALQSQDLSSGQAVNKLNPVLSNGAVKIKKPTDSLRMKKGKEKKNEAYF